MTLLNVNPTKSSPLIKFDPSTSVLEIRGESYPENCNDFYAPVLNWLEQYIEREVPRIELNMEVIYFNSSSSKTFMDMFDILDDAASAGKKVVINWLYHEDNEIAQECGEEFMEDVDNIRFNLVEIPS
ncbi:MAG: DUF1987 domain-containing protein [Desulfovibrio sp.]